MTWHDLPLLMGIFMVASVIQGAAGVGFGLFAVAALSLMAPLDQTTPILAIANLPVVLYVFARLWREAAWSHLTPILIGLLVGVPVGIFLLVKLPDDLLLRTLGLILVFAAVNLVRVPNRALEAPAPPQGPGALLARLGVGFASGALAGAYNTGGPPIVAYVFSHPWTKEQRVATMQAVFVLSLLSRIAIMAAADLYTREALLISAACLPASVLGMVLGYAVFSRIPGRFLELGAAAFLLVTGIKLIINP